MITALWERAVRLRHVNARHALTVAVPTGSYRGEPLSDIFYLILFPLLCSCLEMDGRARSRMNFGGCIYCLQG